MVPWQKISRLSVRTALILNCFAQVALAIITYAYLRETKALTKHSEEQLQQLKQNSSLEHLPTLTMSVDDFEEREYTQSVLADKTLSEEERRTILKRINEKSHLFTCQVKNVGQKVAESLRIFVYDASAKSFVYADNGYDVLSFGETFTAWADPPRHTAAQIVERINEFYNSPQALKPEELPLGETSYLGVMFKDIAGEVYLRKRPFEVNDDGTISHSASELVYAVPTS